MNKIDDLSGTVIGDTNPIAVTAETWCEMRIYIYMYAFITWISVFQSGSRNPQLGHVWCFVARFFDARKIKKKRITNYLCIIQITNILYLSYIVIKKL